MASQNRVEVAVATGRNLISNKSSRSVIFLILTMLVILGLNAMLPLLEGGSHYTETIETYTYAEYKELKESNSHYNLTYATSVRITKYKYEYKAEHPEMTLNEFYKLEPPDYFEVSVYTEFFYQSKSWYLTTTVQWISVILLFYSMFNYLIVRYKSTYPKYLSLDAEMSDINNCILDPVTFEPWMVEVFNRGRKINQHKANVHYKLEKLDKKTKYTTRIAYKDYLKACSEYEEYLKACQELDTREDSYKLAYPLAERSRPIPTRRVKRFMEKKAKLEYYLEDDYINDYVLDGKVKHFVYIHPTFVQCGVNMHGVTSDTYSLIKSDRERIGRQSLGKITRMAVTTMSFAALTTLTVMSSMEKSWIWIVMNIITKIFPLMLQIISAYDYRDQFMDNQLIPNLQARRTISYLYAAYYKLDIDEVKKNAS